MKDYPTKPDKEGFYYETEEEQNLNIQSKTHENGNKVKRVTLSNGKMVIIRQLKGRDTIMARRMENGKDGIDMDTACLSVAAMFDGKTQPPEFYLDELFQPDFIRLNLASNLLNFQ